MTQLSYGIENVKIARKDIKVIVSSYTYTLSKTNVAYTCQ